MKKFVIIAAVAVTAVISCATPDKPATPKEDTIHITPADSLKYLPDSMKHQ